MPHPQPSSAPKSGTPAPSARGWTPERKAGFLDRLAARGNVRLACARIGLSAEAAYRLRRRDPLFARAWAAALALAQDKNEEVLADRAIDGIEEEVWHRGELVGTRRRYDTRLFLAHLARIDRQVERGSGGADAARFDELLALIAGADAPARIGRLGDPLPLDREASGARAAAFTEAEMRDDLCDRPYGNGDTGTPPLEDWEVEQICEDAARDARAEAEALWDAWRERAFATVDRAADQSDAPPASEPPGKPQPALACAPTTASEAGFSARTMSTASTSTLARALAGPVSHFTPPPVPRRPQRR